MAEQDNLPSGNQASRPQATPTNSLAGVDEKLAVSPKTAYSPKFAVITILSVVIIAGLVLLLLPNRNVSPTNVGSIDSTAESLKNSIQSLLPEPSLGELDPPPVSLENSRPSGLVKRANNNISTNQTNIGTFQEDSDADGLIDRLEIRYQTDSNKADTDGDGLNDLLEIYVYDTDPLTTDTDGDGFSDKDEVNSGHNPNGSG